MGMYFVLRSIRERARRYTPWMAPFMRVPHSAAWHNVERSVSIPPARRGSLTTHVAGPSTAQSFGRWAYNRLMQTPTIVRMRNPRMFDLAVYVTVTVLAVVSVIWLPHA